MAPNERDVGPVQRGDEPRPAGALEHLAREPGGSRVRDRVVDVHEVESPVARHLVDRYREREGVGGVLEERVVRHLHLVEEHPLAKAGEAEGGRIGEEVDLVAARGEPEPEFGGHRSRPAVRRIARNPDLHAPATPPGPAPVRRHHASTRSACASSGSET